MYVCTSTCLCTWAPTKICTQTRTYMNTHSYAHRTHKHGQRYTHANICACANACPLRIRAHAPGTHGRARSQAGQRPREPCRKAGKSQLAAARPRLGLRQLCVGVSRPPASRSVSGMQTAARPAPAGLRLPVLSVPHLPDPTPAGSLGRRTSERLLLTVCPSPLQLRRNALPSLGLSFPGCKTEGWFLGIPRSRCASLPNYTALILPTLAACFLEPSADNSLSPEGRSSDGGDCRLRDHLIRDVWGVGCEVTVA